MMLYRLILECPFCGGTFSRQKMFKEQLQQDGPEKTEIEVFIRTCKDCGYKWEEHPSGRR